MFSHSCVEVIVSLIRVEFFGLNSIPIRSTSSDAHEDLQVRTRLQSDRNSLFFGVWNILTVRLPAKRVKSSVRISVRVSSPKRTESCCDCFSRFHTSADTCSAAVIEYIFIVPTNYELDERKFVFMKYGC